MINLLLGIIYLAFISLGLPDAVLGSAWTLISGEFGVTISSMGLITTIISLGTIISSLNSDRMIRKIGTHKITALSVAMTAVSLLGFASSPSYIFLCLWAIPYGLGAGAVDAALNNYVSLHFESKHMSWLHCMWGVGATAGPYIMGMALTNNMSFRGGYHILFGIQIALTLMILMSAPAWKANKQAVEEAAEQASAPMTLREIFKIKGVVQIAIAFFCFCAIEASTGLWASSYLVHNRGVEPEIAAGFTALFYLGITVGRGINGFIVMKYTDSQMIRVGSVIMAIGLIILLLPLGEAGAFAGLLMVGFGSAPVYPCIIHSTPLNFGVQNSQAITGVQMASAYTGVLLMPPLLGIIADNVGFVIYPYYILILLISMVIMYELMLRKVKTK